MWSDFICWEASPVRGKDQEKAMSFWDLAGTIMKNHWSLVFPCLCCVLFESGNDHTCCTWLPMCYGLCALTADSKGFDMTCQHVPHECFGLMDLMRWINWLLFLSSLAVPAWITHLGPSHFALTSRFPRSPCVHQGCSWSQSSSVFTLDSEVLVGWVNKTLSIEWQLRHEVNMLPWLNLNMSRYWAMAHVLITPFRSSSTSGTLGASKPNDFSFFSEAHAEVVRRKARVQQLWACLPAV